MKTTGSRFALMAIVAVGLAACTGTGKNNEPDPNIFPKDYKAEILLTLQRELDDPTNIRDGFVTEPFLTQGASEQRYAVCVRSNSRNMNREYTGIKDRIGFFYAGHLNQLIPAAPEQCSKAAYKPWPELQTICLSGSTCK